ncbi:lipid II flippase MurJ [Dietzia aerolata]|uniref:lipid II flippase MurJ n=1 Tax=Dietzia aerolata TaxID=595984 RepID=UPI00364370E7
MSFIRRLLTVTSALALVVTVIAVACAPLLTELNLGDGEVNTSLATAFAFLLLPQIFFYGVFSVMLAVLNYNGVFRPGAWAPVWNNLVAIATLGLFAVVGSGIDPAAQVNILSPRSCSSASAPRRASSSRRWSWCPPCGARAWICARSGAWIRGSSSSAGTRWPA